MSLPDLVDQMRPVLWSCCWTELGSGQLISFALARRGDSADGDGNSREVSMIRVVTSCPGVTEAGMVTSGRVVRGASLTKASLIRSSGQQEAQPKAVLLHDGRSWRQGLSSRADSLRRLAAAL